MADGENDSDAVSTEEGGSGMVEMYSVPLMSRFPLMLR